MKSGNLWKFKWSEGIYQLIRTDGTVAATIKRVAPSTGQADQYHWHHDVSDYPRLRELGFPLHGLTLSVESAMENVSDAILALYPATVAVAEKYVDRVWDFEVAHLAFPCPIFKDSEGTWRLISERRHEASQLAKQITMEHNLRSAIEAYQNADAQAKAEAICDKMFNRS